MAGLFEYSNEPGSIKGEEYLHHLSDYQVLKEDPASSR
jgi:hypothetical protein